MRETGQRAASAPRRWTAASSSGAGTCRRPRCARNSSSASPRCRPAGRRRKGEPGTPVPTSQGSNLFSKQVRRAFSFSCVSLTVLPSFLRCQLWPSQRKKRTAFLLNSHSVPAEGMGREQVRPREGIEDIAGPQTRRAQVSQISDYSQLAVPPLALEGPRLVNRSSQHLRVCRAPPLMGRIRWSASSAAGRVSAARGVVVRVCVRETAVDTSQP